MPQELSQELSQKGTIQPRELHQPTAGGQFESVDVLRQMSANATNVEPMSPQARHPVGVGPVDMAALQTKAWQRTDGIQMQQDEWARQRMQARAATEQALYGGDDRTRSARRPGPAEAGPSQFLAGEPLEPRRVRLQSPTSEQRYLQRSGEVDREFVARVNRERAASGRQGGHELTELDASSARQGVHPKRFANLDSNKPMMGQGQRVELKSPTSEQRYLQRRGEVDREFAARVNRERAASGRQGGHELTGSDVSHARGGADPKRFTNLTPLE